MQPFRKKANKGAPLSTGEGKGVRIVFYSPQTLPSIGGLQYVVHYWAEALSKRGYMVTVISETPESTNQPVNSSTSQLVNQSTSQPIHPSTSQPDYTILRNIPFLQQVATMRSADKVIMFNVSLKGMPAWLWSGKALYLSHHTALWYENGPRPWQQRIKQWVANHLAKKNCACSGYIASLYKSCEVIYSPFRSDVFVPGTLPRIPGSILFAGRLVSDKGADLLLEACAILKAKGIAFSLTIVGDGPDRQKLIALAEKLKVFKNNPSSANLNVNPFHIVGTHTSVNIHAQQDFPLSTKVVSEPVSPLAGAVPQPLLVHLMQTHQVMVVPSRMEPMGMVVAEGLACGCRMVVSNQGGMPEVGGKFCHYFECGNASALAVALETALTNPLRPDSDALNAHLRQFTIEYSVDQLEKWLA